MNVKSLISKSLKKIGFKINYKKSYSQCGEDIIIQFIFNNLKITKPTYIDIGANHPFLINNTFLFYKSGSRGINIEPNISLYNKLKKERRRDINLCLGISDKIGELDFYKISPNPLSTFSKEEAYKLRDEYNCKIEEIIKVKVETLPNIIQKYCNGIFPDLLSIDVEGLDEKILKSIDFENSSPTIIVAETSDFSLVYRENLKRHEIIDFLKNKGYIDYADTRINTIFVKKEKLLQN
jgi:FkbM family methyltransferase